MINVLVEWSLRKEDHSGTHQLLFYWWRDLKPCKHWKREWTNQSHVHELLMKSIGFVSSEVINQLE